MVNTVFSRPSVVQDISGVKVICWWEVDSKAQPISVAEILATAQLFFPGEVTPENVIIEIGFMHIRVKKR